MAHEEQVVGVVVGESEVAAIDSTVQHKNLCALGASRAPSREIDQGRSERWWLACTK
jgi:hypothetical protein